MRVVAYTTPARGHLYPIVPILAELVGRSHQIVLYTLSGELTVLAGMGIAARAVDPAVERCQLEDWRARSPRRAALSAMSTFAERAAAEAPDLAHAIEMHNPDVLLVDINAWGAATVAEASGLPWVMYSPYLLPLPSRDAPPFGPGLAPRRDLLGALRDMLLRGAGSRLVERPALVALNALRAQHGLPPLDRLSDRFRSPRLVLSLTAEGFEYPRSTWPANIRLVGPVNWAPPSPAPKWLAGTSDPLVLVTCSTERQADASLLHVALKALPTAGMSVIGTSAAHDPAEFRAPPGSRVTRFIPHDAVLSRAVCVVCHGGMGITQKALAAGVPVVAVPFGRDQLETARRVEVAGAGVRLSRRRLSPEHLLTAVATAVKQGQGVESVQFAYAGAGGEMSAADAIEGRAGAAPTLRSLDRS